MDLLIDKVIVITGGTRGFGLAMARAFIQEGAIVVVTSRSQQATIQVVESLIASGARAGGKACDVSELEQVRTLADYALAEFGRIDVWVNNAGTAPPYGPTAHVAVEDFVRSTRSNVLGAYYGSVTAMRYFLQQGRGKLINILGRGEDGPQPMQNAYASSKAWLKSFTLALAKEYKTSGVGVYAFNPGMMDTEMLTDVDVISGYEDRLRNFDFVVQALSQPPEESARRAVWLASAATDGKTGMVVREMNTARVLGRFLRVGLSKLLRRPERPVAVRVTTKAAEFSEKGE